MQYRAEIDGLRAIAVLSVIFFHAGVTAVPGGYVGVDIFFVISGFLITQIIREDLRKGSFSFANFYERRARRILPALLVVLAFTIMAAWMYMQPFEMKYFSQSIISVVLFCSNIMFWFRTGYFDIQAENKPLLHTWSLGVEEQFYLIYPICLLALLGASRRPVLALSTAALASLALCQFLPPEYTDFKFYWLPTRAWELLAGAICVFVTPLKPSLLSNALSMAGLAGLAVPIFFFNTLTPVPSVYTLAPVLGACLILTYATHGTVAQRLLSQPVLVGIGLISYSAYLWHQPLFAFARIRPIEPPSQATMLMLVAVTFAVAAFSYHFVEAPWRSKKFRPFASRKVLIYCGLTAAAAAVSFGVAGHVTRGFPNRVPTSEQALLMFRDYDSQTAYGEGKCFLGGEQSYQALHSDCTSANRDAPVLWGDSHAAAMAIGIRQEIGAISEYTGSGCPPILNVEIPGRSYCKANNDFFFEKIAASQPRRIFLGGYWTKYRLPNEFEQLKETVLALHQRSPESEIIILGSLPVWYPTLPEFMIRRGMTLESAAVGSPDSLDQLRAFDSRLKSLETIANVRFLSVLDRFCPESKCPLVADDNGDLAPVAWDESHLTAAGSIMVADQMGLAQFRY